ncbi:MULTISPECIES: glycosyltransferase [Mesorhizobium]|uniref:glycosyltransferase n=1 Tax=Mesorhizobium TaxID=68287 RepID=UPI001459FF47|nr:MULTISPECIES: glycosyltransferase [Mesorhizobium]
MLNRARAVIRGQWRRHPPVSVIIKSYNHEKYVAKTIGSVLEQTFQDFQLVITDDGSTDATVKVIKGFSDPRIDFVALPLNQGLSNAMNVSLQRATGEFVAILNSDDYADPTRLERQFAYLTLNPATAAVFSEPRIIDEDGNERPPLPIFALPLSFRDFSVGTWLRQFFLGGNCLCAPSAMIRASAYRAAGAYDRHITNLQDLDMWIRMLGCGELHVLPDRLTSFRIRANNENLSAPRRDTQLRWPFEYAQILRRFLNLDERLLRGAFADAFASNALSPDLSVAQCLAELALVANTPSHVAFALETLFATARTDADFARLREVSGTVNVFSLHVETNRTL